MNARVMAVLLVAAGTLAVGVDSVWAQAKVAVTREESRPQKVEIKAGEEVQFINNSGGTAHVMFGGNEAIKFYLGKGTSKVRFDKAGTYDYTVHVSGTKVHAHTGSVVVK